MMRKITGTLFTFLMLLVSCSEDDSSTEQSDNFNRQEMLANMANNIIIPAYENFNAKVTDLVARKNSFVEVQNVSTLEQVRNAWKETYRAWQKVSMFQIGKAEEISFSSFMNSYPVSVENVVKNISNKTYDLSAVSKQDEQGLPALDYLLNGLATTDDEIIGIYTNATNGKSYVDYLDAVVNRMAEMSNVVLTDWKTSFKSDFITNNGSSATSSLDKIVNDYIYHYERNLRAGKIGIPAGVFSKELLANKIEAFYDGTLSKELFLINLQAMQDLFNGKSFNDTTNGPGFSNYLRFLNTLKNGKKLDDLINNQFEQVKEIAKSLAENLSQQVQQDNTLMLQTYDALQKNVVFLKVDMLQAMSISVDFVDADGD